MTDVVPKPGAGVAGGVEFWAFVLIGLLLCVVTALALLLLAWTVIRAVLL